MSDSENALRAGDGAAERKRKPEYGSDVIVDALQGLGLPLVTLNPGASFRGLHDSLVNYGELVPPMMLCTHEKIAVQIAHGYAKASGQPLGVIVHDLVGLLHATMGIYYAYHDRVPMVVLGGAGPMDTESRRPNIDWYHTANVQGNAVRDYTKWDDQPASVEAIPASLARAYRVALSSPPGPVYVALDAALQEQSLESEPQVFDCSRVSVPTRMAADPSALEQLVDLLEAAQRPLVVAGYAGRDPSAFDLLTELAELTGCGVVDGNERLNFPSRHPLNATGTGAPAEADLIVFVDCKDIEKHLASVDVATRRKSPVGSDALKVVTFGFNDLGISSWSHDFGALVDTHLDITVDTSVGLGELVSRLRSTEWASPGRAHRGWRDRIASLQQQTWDKWERQREADHDLSPVSTSRLSSEVWEAIKDYDWVLTAGTAKNWANRIWDFDAKHRHAGRALGTGTQIGISLGVALANKGKGRLVVDLQPDGDLLFDPGALWTAAYYEIPLLVVMFNNRAYYNDWAHQEAVAVERQRPVENAYIGMEIASPAPDFATIARGFDWYADGPIAKPDDVGSAVRKAAEVVLRESRPALVDVICQPA